MLRQLSGLAILTWGTKMAMPYDAYENPDQDLEELQKQTEALAQQQVLGDQGPQAPAAQDYGISDDEIANLLNSGLAQARINQAANKQRMNEQASRLPIAQALAGLGAGFEAALTKNYGQGATRAGQAISNVSNLAQQQAKMQALSQDTGFLKPIMALAQQREKQRFDERMMPQRERAKIEALMQLKEMEQQGSLGQIAATGEEQRKTQAESNAAKAELEKIRLEAQKAKDAATNALKEKELGIKAKAGALKGAGGKAEKPASADQFKAAGFVKNMELAEKDWEAAQRAGADQTSFLGSLTSKYAPDIMKPEALKLAEQAQRNFIAATLRRESGAAISDSEFANEAKKYFPQAGDTPAVLQQKKLNRLQKTASMLAEAGPAYNQIQTIQPNQGQVKVVNGKTYVKVQGGWKAQ